MPAQQVGSNRHGEQHAREQYVVTQPAGLQQQRVGRLVDGERAGGHGEEARRRANERSAMTAKRQRMMSRERDEQRDQPAGHVGDQRPQPDVTDERHHHGPVDRRGGTADGDEPGHPSLGSGTRSQRSGRGDAAHGAGEHTRRSICLAVDDFGLHPGICAAALRLVALGRVHAIGCQVGGRSWTEGAPALRSLVVGEVDLGLHLDLTERPLGIAPRPLGRLVAASLLRRIDAGAVRLELQTQLDSFENAVGRRPDYLDGHQHVHQLPVVRDVVLDELSRRYRSALPWLRSTRPAGGWFPRGALGWRDAAKARVVAALGGPALAKRARALGFEQNERLCGVYDFSAVEEGFLARLDGWLAACATGDLLMCHPSAAADAGDALADTRAVEYHILAGDGFGALLRAHEVVLEPMSRLIAARARAAAR